MMYALGFSATGRGPALLRDAVSPSPPAVSTSESYLMHWIGGRSKERYAQRQMTRGGFQASEVHVAVLAAVKKPYI